MRIAVCAAIVAAVGLFASVSGTQPVVGNLFKLTSYQATYQSACLDGTAPAYYFVPGTTTGAAKWYIHHQGGGWCESFEDCYGRSKTSLGSSMNYPATTNFDSMGGYFSSSQQVNPMMWNWNKVFIKYCDGASYSGSNLSTTVYNGKQLYFRGKHNLDSIIYDLTHVRGLNTATDVVISGCSAGGLATFLHADKWASFLPQAHVVAMPDSGFFLDYQGIPSLGAGSHGVNDIGPGVYRTDMQWVFLNQNVTSGVHQGCIAAYPEDQQWMCMFAEHTAPFIQTPTFPLQSQYDAWQIGNVLQESNNVELILQMGQNITSRLKTNLVIHPQHGVFLDSCDHHCGEWGNIVIEGDNQATAFQSWYENPSKQRVWIQPGTYPCASCCKP